MAINNHVNSGGRGNNMFSESFHGLEEQLTESYTAHIQEIKMLEHLVMMVVQLNYLATAAILLQL